MQILAIRTVKIQNPKWRLSPEQERELARIAVDHIFNATIPERKLANMGYIVVSMRIAGAHAELTVQGRLHLANVRREEA